MAKEYRKFTMTRKRSDWVGTRDATLRGTPMRVNEASANRAANEAQSMVYAMHKDISKQVNNLFKTPTAKNSIVKAPDKITTENVAMDASIASQSRMLMNGLIAKWQKRFNVFGNDFAKKMIGTVDKQASNDLKQHLVALIGPIRGRVSIRVRVMLG